MLAVMPGTYISNIIAQWKHRLVNEIGEFGSDESLAHLTMLGFDTDKQPLEYWISKISAFCYNCPSREISFEGFASFGFSTFYIKPDKNSRKYLNELIRKLRQHFHLKAENINAHMTIARELDEARMKKAFELFKGYEPNFQFICDGLILRKFNKNEGQYSDFIAEFKFSEQQIKLF
jgi:hypothetical protein